MFFIEIFLNIIKKKIQKSNYSNLFKKILFKQAKKLNENIKINEIDVKKVFSKKIKFTN